MARLSNKQINQLLRSAFTDAAPDSIEQIIGAADKDNRLPTYSITQKNYKHSYLKRAGLIAAAMVIVVGAAVLLTTIHNRTPYASITVESDECVEILLNRDNHPLSVSGKNNAAIRLAREIEKADSIEEMIDSTLDTMLEGGHLGEDNNTILITVDAPEDGEELLKESLKAAKASFRESEFSGAILSTIASEDKRVGSISSRYNISVGKAEMVNDIVRADHSFSTELLCRLSVGDLNLLSMYRSISYQNIGVFGVSRGCIAPDLAVRYVNDDLGIIGTSADISLGADRYGLIYTVTVAADDGVFIYRLRANSGEILAVSQGESRHEALMNDADTPTPTPDDKRSSPTNSAEDSAQTPQTIRTIITYNEPTKAAELTEPTKAAPTPTTHQKSTPTVKPAQKSQKPTQKATEAPKHEAATSAPQKSDPEIFTANSYLSYSGGIQEGSPLSPSAKPISVKRIMNGYNTYYTHADFPYSPEGKQGGISALVCTRAQFIALTGTDDSRFDDSYFSSHALYIHMNRDVSYHWIKSVQGAYMDGGTLCIENSEPVGYYITTDSENPERIYTVVYELNKSDLKDFVNLVEYTE